MPTGPSSTPDFDGETYEHERDYDRLTSQLGRVRELMADGEWRTLAAISSIAGCPEASVSARLRDLRKPKFGGYTVERGYAGDGLWQYRLLLRPRLRCVKCKSEQSGDPKGSMLGGFAYGYCTTCGEETTWGS
jgi:hypothetical protein